jgi:hypothetical protein
VGKILIYKNYEQYSRDINDLFSRAAMRAKKEPDFLPENAWDRRER